MSRSSSESNMYAKKTDELYIQSKNIFFPERAGLSSAVETLAKLLPVTLSPEQSSKKLEIRLRYKSGPYIVLSVYIELNSQG